MFELPPRSVECIAIIGKNTLFCPTATLFTPFFDQIIHMAQTYRILSVKPVIGHTRGCSGEILILARPPRVEGYEELRNSSCEHESFQWYNGTSDVLVLNGMFNQGECVASYFYCFEGVGKKRKNIVYSVSPHRSISKGQVSSNLKPLEGCTQQSLNMTEEDDLFAKSLRKKAVKMFLPITSCPCTSTPKTCLHRKGYVATMKVNISGEEDGAMYCSFLGAVSTPTTKWQALK